MQNILEKISKLFLSITGIIITVISIIPEIIPSIPLFYRIIFSLIGLILTVLPFLWNFTSTKIKYTIERMQRRKIGLSLDTEENDKIVKYCNEEITKINLENKIIFKAIQTTNNSEKKFRELIESTNFDVIVWTPKSPKNGKVPLAFIYKNTIDNVIARIVHHEMLDMKAKEKRFTINKETLVVDLNLERSNIMNFALYIVAMCTTLFRGIDEGILVFEKLYENVKVQEGILKRNTLHKLGSIYCKRSESGLQKKVS